VKRGGDMNKPGWPVAVVGALAVALLALWAAPPVAHAQRADAVKSFSAKLTPESRKLFEGWLSAQNFHVFELDAYWRQITDKRAIRRSKRHAGKPLLAEDYVATYPPEYSGPQLTSELAKAWAEHQRALEVPVEPPTPVLTVADALAAAKEQYDFVPTRIDEREFKRRYAREALALGLTKDQVVRVYALETGGIGTADMQAGIHPITHKGKAISTALGYAQLLHANSVDEVSQHGAQFLERLKAMSAAAGANTQLRASLQAKHTALKRMVANARSVGSSWDRHVAYARTAKGIGIHALNLDGDIGPWLQVVKLNGLKVMAERAGMAQLSGAEIELMNLAGPGTGLEMMQGAARNAPTPNFFSRAGYYRNTIVRGKTSTELMAALEKRMGENITKPGAVEFAAVFDELLAERQAARR
jgi:hypothetical protein